ncbi:MAG TPA: hypothetical protein VJ768_02805 [Anaerolineales bacterium]|nr:hypothetical protein [Anaerolineales bacterium]
MPLPFLLIFAAAGWILAACSPTATGSLTATISTPVPVASTPTIPASEEPPGRDSATRQVLALHREGGLAGICEDVAVLITGEYWINSCAGDSPMELDSGRLDPDQFELLNQWTDKFQNFEWADKSEVPVDGLAQELVFAGSGSTPAGESDRLQMLELIAELSGESAGPEDPGEPTQPNLILSASPCEAGAEPGDWCLLGPEESQPLVPPTTDTQLLSFDPETLRVLYASRFPDHGAGPGNMAVGDLWVWDITSGETRAIIPEETVIRASWAPDGSIAYIQATESTNELRWRSPTGEDRLIAEDVPHLFSISPSGEEIAFSRESHYNLDRHTPGLYVVSLDTGEERRIAGADRAGQGSSEDTIAWSPDGNSLIMPVSQDWLLASADGSASGMLSFDESLAGEPWFEYHPNRLLWFPTGERLVAAIETGGPGLPEPVQWWTLALELDPSNHRLKLIEAVENTGILLGWDVPGESVWIIPIDAPSLPRSIPLDGS